MPKSMENQCKIHARKSDAENMENHQKWRLKGSLNETKGCKTEWVDLLRFRPIASKR